jgi:hypothetical protein
MACYRDNFTFTFFHSSEAISLFQLARYYVVFQFSLTCVDSTSDIISCFWLQKSSICPMFLCSMFAVDCLNRGLFWKNSSSRIRQTKTVITRYFILKTKYCVIRIKIIWRELNCLNYYIFIIHRNYLSCWFRRCMFSLLSQFLHANAGIVH